MTGNRSVALTEDGNVRPALVPYLRVSTDDKGQDPKRQLASIGPWADREGFILLAPEVDEGVSASKVPALERAFFIRACERGEAARAKGLVIETPDRFSRMDPITAVWELVEVKRRYGLEIFFACVPLEYQASPMGRLVTFLQMASAHQWAIDHSKKVETGMARASAKGVKFGRKPKRLSADEIEQVKAWRAEDRGWEKIAVFLNEGREIHTLTDKAVAYERMVSSGSLRRMATEGVFGPEEMEREDADAGNPDETDSSQPVAVSSDQEVVTSGPEGSP